MHKTLISTLSQYQKIILVGGWTGGHIQPILNLLSSWGGFREAKDGGLVRDFLWIGGRNSNEEQEAKNHQIPFESISTLKLSTTMSPKVLLYPFVLIRWIFEARNILSMHYALCTMHWMCVFSKWWPGSVAIGIAAWTLNIPLYIHESDTIPGRSNRILGRFATKIFLGFESAKKYFDEEKCEVVGQILHPVFSSLRKELSWAHANDWGLVSQSEPSPIPLPHSGIPLSQGSPKWQTQKPHILVICGSQWSRAIFEEILQNLETLLEDAEMILVLWKLNTDMRKDFENSLSFRRGSGWVHLQLIDWLSQSDLAHLIPDADLAITRGSATTLAELTYLSHWKHKTENWKPLLIIIPLPHSADNHQYHNAKEYEKMGHILLEQKNIHQLTETIQKYV